MLQLQVKKWKKVSENVVQKHENKDDCACIIVTISILVQSQGKQCRLLVSLGVAACPGMHFANEQNWLHENVLE